MDQPLLSTYWFLPKNDSLSITEEGQFNRGLNSFCQWPVVYFYQYLVAVHSKCWSKSAFFTLLACFEFFFCKKKNFGKIFLLLFFYCLPSSEFLPLSGLLTRWWASTFGRSWAGSWFGASQDKGHLMPLQKIEVSSYLT